MSAKTWVACCLLLLLPTLWFLWPTQGAPDAGAPGVVTDAGAAAPAAPRPALGPPAAATQRTSVAVVPDPAPTDSRHGELVVSVRWAEDQTPAAGIGVTVHPVAGRGLLDQEGTTDRDGVARLAAVTAGTVQVILDRAGTRDLEVVAGRSTRVELSLPVGMTVTGVVLDPHDQPVPQATIWLSREQIDDQGQAVGRSGPDGRFAVRGVASERVVGARAPGWVPSRLERVQGTPGSRHELTLRLTQPGGALHGRVFDALRRPIAGARVQVGDCLPNGRAMVLGPLGIVGAAPLLAWTGSDGGFAVDGVPGDAPPPGREVRVFAGAPGFAPWQGVARCSSGRATELDIVLTRGATVSGRVTDPFGRPLANVLVLAGDGAFHTAQPTWMRGSMTTGSEGTFCFAGLPAGALEMYAQTRTGAATRDTVVWRRAARPAGIRSWAVGGASWGASSMSAAHLWPGGTSAAARAADWPGASTRPTRRGASRSRIAPPDRTAWKCTNPARAA